MKRTTVMTLSIALVCAPHASAQLGSECPVADGSFVPTVGERDCVRIDAEDTLGALAPVSYYVPPACDPAAHPDRRCPVLYYLHGTGGSYGVPAAIIRALTHGPVVDPRTVEEPWLHSDPAAWVDRNDPLDMIVVSPHGRTLPGGFGPEPGADTAWSDWNPKYAKGGEYEVYDTPPPRFATYLTDVLISFVEARLPAIADRSGRATIGVSLGGWGSFGLALLHPDSWSSLAMISGAAAPWLVVGPESGSEPAVAPPGPVPYLSLPGPSPVATPSPLFGVTYGALATVGFGDIVVDSAYWRRQSPTDLAWNARARSSGGRQAIHLKYFVNDAIPRRVEDFANPVGYAAAQAFETIVMPTNQQLEQVFDRLGVERTFDFGPGIHSGAYWFPYYRSQLEEQYANLAHHDGGGDPPPDPAVFDYRTIDREFSVWEWTFRVDREPVEFLTLTDVSCEALTLRGTGSVRVTVPAGCGTGLDGSSTFTVDLGPDQATDEPLGLGGSGFYGQTVTVRLETLP